MRGYEGIDAGAGQQDDPGEEPYWEEHDGNHTKETNEEVGVHAIYALDVGVVCFDDGREPCEEASTDRVDSFTEKRDEDGQRQRIEDTYDFTGEIVRGS